MFNLFIIFAVSLLLTGSLLWLKMVEVERGRRIVIPHVREFIDHSMVIIPVFLSRELRLALARLALKGHAVTSHFHDLIEVFRGFFRRRSIRLFASVHTEVPAPVHQSFWQKVAHRGNKLPKN